MADVVSTDWGKVGGKTLTLSFWVKSSVTNGPLGIIVSNGASNNSYGALYAIDTADAWERKVVTVPAPPTGSLWSSGIYLTFTMTAVGGVGNGGIAPTGWSTYADVWGVVGQTDLTLVDGSTVSFTGVQVEVGYVVTDFEIRPATIERTLVSTDMVVNGNLTVGGNLTCSGAFGTFSNAVRVLNGGDSTTVALSVTGNIEATGDIVAYSDRALKADLVPITSALDKVRRLAGYTFSRADEPSGRRRMGLIAQDVQAVAPEAVMTGTTGHLTVAYGNLAGLFVEAIKELKIMYEA
jgi:hypothetical protein